MPVFVFLPPSSTHRETLAGHHSTHLDTKAALHKNTLLRLRDVKIYVGMQVLHILHLPQSPDHPHSV